MLKVLTFLRTDRVAKNKDGESTKWICILIPVMRSHLKSMGVTLPPDFGDRLKSLYRKQYKKPSPQLFLSTTSSLTGIPSGDKWRQSPDCTYQRAAMVQRAAISPATLEILDKGI